MRYVTQLPKFDGDLSATVDQLLAQVHERLMAARSRWPRADYAARIYQCPSCEALNGAVAPARDLVDGYRCPLCSGRQEPVTPVGAPT